MSEKHQAAETSVNEFIETAFVLNGQNVSARVKAGTTLLDYLRREHGLFGARNGCGTGHCGACTVLLNGRPIKSCVTKMSGSRLSGALIETVEGLSGPDGELHPIQKAFVDAGAVQCGFCTPGMILTAKALLDANPDPTREEIRKYIAPRNLCRCTGYAKIIDAVEEAGRLLRGEAPRLAEKDDDAALRRSDAAERVTARIRYADDIHPEGVLYGAVFYSEEPHAVLEELRLDASLAVDGVAGVLRAEDVKGSNRIGMVDRDEPGLVPVGGEIRSVADPLCVLFAETPEAASAALEAAEAVYRTLPGVFDMDAALKDGAPQVNPSKPGNVFYEETLVRGDAEAALAKSHTVVEGIFTTERVIHGYMEPESGHAEPDGNGGVIIRYPTQTVYDDRRQVAECVGLPEDKVRVIQLPTGGAFGGKEDVLLQHLLALGALKFNRPVKITLTRAQSLQAVQKKHPSRFKARLGLDGNGRFTALQADILTDKGAYAAIGFDIIENMMAFVGGPYYIPEVSIHGVSVHTHNVMTGAMRGFGANQANFVIESLVDMAVCKTGADPYEIRIKNALRPGLPTVTGHVLEPGLPGAVEVIEALRSAAEREEAPPIPAGFVPGFGIACGVKNIGFGHNFPESAGARVVLSSDGSIRLFVTHHEYGQGAAAGQAKIVSKALGVPVDRVTIHEPDTGATPFAGATTASRQTFLSGNATLGACRTLLSDLLEKAAAGLGIQNPGVLVLEGDAVVEKNGERKISLADLGGEFTAEYRSFAPETEGFPEEPMPMLPEDRSGGARAASSEDTGCACTSDHFHRRENAGGADDVDGADGPEKDGGRGSFKDGAKPLLNYRTHWCYGYGAQAAWTAVNPETGAVKVLKIVTAGDIGNPLNPRAVEGQQEGGVGMGVGYALSEEFRTEEGRAVTKTLGACGLPKANEVPEIINVLVEVPHPWGPYGVKGLAEVPSLATAPAIIASVCDAVGVRMTHLPATPEKMKAALKEAGG